MLPSHQSPRYCPSTLLLQHKAESLVGSGRVAPLPPPSIAKHTAQSEQRFLHCQVSHMCPCCVRRLDSGLPVGRWVLLWHAEYSSILSMRWSERESTSWKTVSTILLASHPSSCVSGSMNTDLILRNVRNASLDYYFRKRLLSTVWLGSSGVSSWDSAKLESGMCLDD